MELDKAVPIAITLVAIKLRHNYHFGIEGIVTKYFSDIVLNADQLFRMRCHWSYFLFTEVSSFLVPQIKTINAILAECILVNISVIFNQWFKRRCHLKKVHKQHIRDGRQVAEGGFKWTTIAQIEPLAQVN